MHRCDDPRFQAAPGCEYKPPSSNNLDSRYVVVDGSVVREATPQVEEWIAYRIIGACKLCGSPIYGPESASHRYGGFKSWDGHVHRTCNHSHPLHEVARHPHHYTDSGAIMLGFVLTWMFSIGAMIMVYHVWGK